MFATYICLDRGNEIFLVTAFIGYSEHFGSQFELVESLAFGVN
jgi:hypothetical protein